jgi:nucleotide-binding universal stress UspA family protein
VETAIRLAADPQQELVVAHILDDDPQYSSSGLVTTDPELRQQIEATGQTILQEVSQLAQQAQVTYRTVLRWGGIPEQIVQVAASAQCDLIVMGTRHLSGDKRLMAGRICNAVIATALCPVLVVPFIQLG